MHKCSCCGDTECLLILPDWAVEGFMICPSCMRRLNCEIGIMGSEMRALEEEIAKGRAA